MRTISDGMAAVLRSGSIDVVSLVEVIRDGVVQRTLDLVEGEVAQDATARIRRRFSATLTDETGDLTPETGRDLLAPFGTEIRVNSGVLVDGTAELVPMGVFGLKRCHVTHDADGGLRIELEGYDRARRISRAGWETPFVVPAGSNVTDVVRRILLDRYPGLPLDLAETSVTTGVNALILGEQASNDPYGDAQDFARAAGMDLFLAADGRGLMRPTPDPDTAPIVWTFVEGETSTLLEVEKDLDDEDAVSVVIALGEATSNATPARGVAEDDNPASPTYVGGPFGRVPMRWTSPLLTDDGQAAEAARALLNRLKGAAEQVAISAVFHPALEADDVVYVADGQLKIDARYIFDQLRTALTATSGRTGGAMRRRRL